jgi:hypothetical protein
MRQKPNAFNRAKSFLQRGYTFVYASPSSHQHGWTRLWHHFTVALFIASILQIFHDHLDPLSIPFLVFLHHEGKEFVPKEKRAISPPNQNELSSVAIVGLSLDDYEKKYGGFETLHRCPLYADLSRIIEGATPGLIATRPTYTVGIDFSLTPPRRLEASIYAKSKDEEAACQTQIDALLDRNAHRITMIYSSEYFDGKTKPLHSDSVRKLICGKPNSTAVDAPVRARHEKIVQWSEARFCEGVTFGHSNLDLEYGIVARTYQTNSKSNYEYIRFGELLSNRWFKQNTPPCLGSKFCKQPIAFEKLENFYNQGNLLSMNDDCLGGISTSSKCALLRPSAPAINHVILGSAYTSDDVWLTPRNLLLGVQVHAAVAARSSIPHANVLAYLFDIAIGVAFGFITHVIWHKFYISVKTSPLESMTWKQIFQLLSPVLLPVLILLACIAAIALSRWLLSLGLWINPVPVLIGLVIDAMLSNLLLSIEMIKSKRKSKSATLRKIWRAIGTFVILFSVYLLTRH